MMKRPVKIVRNLGAEQPAVQAPVKDIIVHVGQDDADPEQKKYSLTDYILDNKWWLVVVVAVGYFALKSED